MKKDNKKQNSANKNTKKQEKNNVEFGEEIETEYSSQN